MIAAGIPPRRQSYQNVSRETFWFSNRDAFVKRHFVFFGCACAFAGIDATAALRDGEGG